MHARPASKLTIGARRLERFSNSKLVNDQPSAIKLKRTETTLDLSQKAEKGMLEWASMEAYIVVPASWGSVDIMGCGEDNAGTVLPLSRFLVVIKDIIYTISNLPISFYIEPVPVDSLSLMKGTLCLWASTFGGGSLCHGADAAHS